MNFATELCLALCKPKGDTNEAIRLRCLAILRHARRYTFLYRHVVAAAALDSHVYAMAPAIFEDIATRRITVLSDVLAIAANCCRYDTRLDA
jgi:hypothetical protein